MQQWSRAAPAPLACPEHRVGMFPWPEKALRQRVAGVYTGRSHHRTSAVVGAEGTWVGHPWHLLCLQLRTVATAALAPQRRSRRINKYLTSLFAHPPNLLLNLIRCPLMQFTLDSLPWHRAGWRKRNSGLWSKQRASNTSAFHCFQMSVSKI